MQAALTSAATFAAGAALPLLAALAGTSATPIVAVTALVFLAALGIVGACADGAPIRAAAIRVTFRGALAMAVTAAIGSAFGAVV